MRAICIQPPLAQLNAPYPAAWYLDAWLRSRGMESVAFDHSIELARLLYSREGLERVFADARAALEGRKHPDKATAGRIRAYFDDEERYIALIDSITAFLAGEDPGFAYRIAVGAGLPAGMRAEAVRGEGLGPDDARAWATATINDLADFICYALDPGFGTVRYSEALARSATSFVPLREGARSGWVLSTFYRPLLRSLYHGLVSGCKPSDKGDDRVIVLLTTPGSERWLPSLPCWTESRDQACTACAVATGRAGSSSRAGFLPMNRACRGQTPLPWGQTPSAGTTPR
jgi:hypothetical protein